MADPLVGDPELRITLAGAFAVTRDGVGFTAGHLGSRKARTMLKLLAVERDHLVPIARIVDVLWSDDPPLRAADNVATLVSRLRRVLGSAAIEGGRDGYRLGRPPAVRVDLDTAARLIHEAESRLAAREPGLALAAAAGAAEILRVGPVLADEADADWPEPARARQRDDRRRLRHVLAQAALEAGEPARARDASWEAVTADPYDETACRLLMSAHRRLGEPARALTVFAELRDLLARDLGADPAPETRELHLSILREDALAPAGMATVTYRRPGSDALGVVGREAELGRLNAAWSGAATGSGSTILIVGEAGIGKTRLASEIVDTVRAIGGMVLAARCYETERSLFLQPVVEAVGTAFRLLAPDVVVAAAGDEAPALAALIPAAATVLGPPARVGRTSVEIERRRAFEAVTAFVRRLSASVPVLLLIDDLHHAGRATIELLHYLARHTASDRVLLIGILRSDEGREAVSLLADVAATLEVGALPADAVHRLAQAAGQGDLAAPILQRTRGHTLFVVETLRGLAAGELGVPVSLQEAVLARVQRAGPGVEELLRAGCVLGASFDPAIAARVLARPLPEVLGRGEEAMSARLLVPSGRDYEFANDLVRDVLYATTSEPMRLSYHLQAADLLTDRPEAVALHASAAQDWARAARAWLLAGEQAWQRFAADDAEDLLTHCLDACERCGDREIRGRALIARARAREGRGAYAEAMVDLEEAVAVAREVGDRRLEMVALRALGGEAPAALGRPMEQALAHLDHGLRIASALGDRAMEAGLLAWLAVLSSAALRFDRAVDYGQRAVLAARASGDDEALAAALDGRKTSLAYLGEVDELAPVLEELVPLLRRLGDAFRLQWALFESAFSPAAAGDWARAAALIQEALDTSRRSGFTAYAPWHIAHLGWLARVQGNADEALRLGRQAVALNDELPHAWCAAAAAAQLGMTLLSIGDVPEAVAVLERGRGFAEQQGSESYLLRCLGPLAEAGGSPLVLAEADRMLRSISTPPGAAWMGGDGVYLCVARAWLATGEPQRARDVLAPLLAVARRVPWVGPLAEGSLVDALALRALGEAGAATGLLTSALEVARRHGLGPVARAAEAALSIG